MGRGGIGSLARPGATMRRGEAAAFWLEIEIFSQEN